MTAQVLILEDEAILSRNLSAALGRSGVSADRAHTIADARKLVRTNTYALICADIQLGDGNGLDFCEALRSDRPDLPVIMMTGQDTARNRHRTEGLGATAFVAKPFSLSRFRELVASLLRERPGTGAPDPEPQSPRVLMYSHDTIGLGHMRRNSAIASRIVARDPRASVLMLVGSPSGIPFDLAPGVDYIKLPSLAKLARDVWRPQSLRITSDEVRSLRMSLIEQAIESYRPDIVLVDHEPGGVWNELVPALGSLRKTRPGVRVILGLRDIIDEPAVTRQTWKTRGTDAVISSLYDDIFVYGDEGIFPSRAAYGLDELALGHVTSCGYVTTLGQNKTRAVKTETRPRIVVAGGGGRDAFPLMAAAVDALRSIDPDERPDADLVAGPLMDEELRCPLETDALASGIRFHRTHENMPELIATASLFVTMGGYNSVVEAIATNCRTLVVPRVGPSAEQRIRAACFAKNGLVETLAPDDGLRSGLEAAFRNLGAAARRPRSISLDGAGRAAELICSAIANQQTAREGAREVG